MEPLHFAAGLGVVGRGVMQSDPQASQFDLDGAPAPAAGGGGEHGPIVGKHRSGKPAGGEAVVEAGDHVGCPGGRVDVGGHQQPGVVVDDVEDLRLGSIPKLPVSDVGLPPLVGLISLKTDV